MAWIPHITVASIIEQNNKFLFVEEYANNLKVLNQPAGHLEEHETLEDGCVRETLEETAFAVKVDYLIGIYQERAKDSKDMWLRFCFKCTIENEYSNRKLDKNIIRKLWLTKKEIQKENVNLRSNMVLKCIEDYELGKKYPKEVICSLLEK
jgi:ADP-ribose pyrophosphatase YjhB (NUDIX family)